MKTKRPKGVIFDFGDTVMHEESFDPLAGYARLLQFVADTKGVKAQDLLAFTNKLNKEMDAAKREHLLEFSLQNLFRLVFDHTGISSDISYAQMEKELWDVSVGHKPSEGISRVLDLLDELGIKAGILSNVVFSGSVLVEDLAKYGLADRFAFVIGSADYGFRKPSPYLFQVAVKKMAFDPGDIWFVGDRLDNDVQGATQAGLVPVWYNPNGKPNLENCPCLEVRTMSELGERLKMCEP